MPSPDEAMERIREMIKEMGDDDLLVRFDSAVKDCDDRDKRISKTLDELLEEVDELLLRIDKIEGIDDIEDCDASPEDKTEESS
ncbi:MAG: hypothetical protein ACE14P_14175 [Methanotrichaceae archaeon]